MVTQAKAMTPLDIFISDFRRRAPSFTARLARDSDSGFLFALCTAIQRERFTRFGVREHPMLEVPALELQFLAEKQGYAATFPNAAHLIFETNNQPIGRFLVDWSGQAAIWGIDLSVMPGYRNGGVGLAALRAWLAVCAETGRPARLSVMHDNPARLIYWRLGFRELTRDDMRSVMVFEYL